VSETATIVIAELEEKPGEKNGRKFTKHAIKDANGTWYSTFDGAVFAPARDLVGKRAEIDYEVSGQFKNLSAVRAAESQNGGGPSEEKWEEIGLRKTRCVIWEQLVGVAMQAGISEFNRRTEGKFDSGQLGGFVQRWGSTLRQIAEADIYLADPVESRDDWIPFLTPAKKPPSGDIEI
jgi:hypothetical protein